MVCPNCSITTQHIQFKFPNTLTTDPIIEHLKRHSHPFQVKENIIETNDIAATDLHDFLMAIYPDEPIYFQIHRQGFRPIKELTDFIEAAWVDNYIKEENIINYFQPIVDANLSIYGYEMLSRFVDHDGNTIYPNIMFPAAKDRGRTFALDRMCRINAVKNSQSLYEDQKAFINFIPTSIYTPEFCLQTTTQLANQLHLNNDRFVFEVVETEQVEDTDHLKSILNYYHKNGFSYALDDVGQGYNTLDFLKDIAPPYIKLDMEYVQGVSTSQDKQKVAKAFLETALSFNATALAEGVETIEDFNWLKTLGYDLFQGYLFGKPSPEPLKQTFIELN
ncbi:EAL domain, c-di-GMP-specific phosphodiesterase class I (or its enzymatically inactive variant) [Pelagirhabdus alkalitolerans]|uniref:EAL domain, c-di-GMP-specific phosphodiesterase class I (Or its enzymatically inactive variant) n=1 Tax=Pelagirhabdus alkalitolerans TaxID=1612202 RepID=A0A1G6L2E0_9BACI|nr:EAL domain-containing protein [Pelagirhabdus alkalitolerans]SDC37337.1 EAL domain, c-di-GMP-specific phosphodiesterase class I (or its enzymatically inactive variant) [Pelagirhabdus alkalitolerans]